MFRDFATENSAPPPCRGDRVPVDVRVLREERVELCEVRPRPDGGGENEGEGEGQRGQGLVEGVHLNKHGGFSALDLISTPRIILLTQHWESWTQSLRIN